MSSSDNRATILALTGPCPLATGEQGRPGPVIYADEKPPLALRERFQAEGLPCKCMLAQRSGRCTGRRDRRAQRCGHRQTPNLSVRRAVLYLSPTAGSGDGRIVPRP